MLHVLRSEENINHNAKRVLTPSRDFLKNHLKGNFVKIPTGKKVKGLRKAMDVE